jgi:hypothetical protein
MTADSVARLLAALPGLWARRDDDLASRPAEGGEADDLDD